MNFVKAKSILSSSNGMNIYRGCTHGCIYCDSRSTCYHTPIPFENIEAAMKKVVSAKKQNLFDLNMKAVELGYNYEE